MIARLWKARTAPDDARRYETLFNEVILPHVTQGVPGYRNANLLKRTIGNEVEFTTLFWFDSMDAIKQFAGEDIERAVVPEEARRLLSRYDKTVQHYEVVL